MAWEYMDKLDYRYELIADYFEDKTEYHWVELNCGNGRLPSYLTYFKSYLGNDINIKEDTEYHIKLKDDEFKEVIIKCDVLVLLGHGGWEIDHNPLESSTLTNSFLYLIDRFKPQYAILESVNKYNSILMSILSKIDYSIDLDYKIESSNWLEDRTLYILKRN